MQLETDVCVIGAGYAGLTAARRLVQGGKDVVVLEARDRVGGRAWTKTGDASLPIDLGATFIGPMHDRLHALVKEVGAELHRSYVSGDAILARGTKVQRYRGDVPRINPLALVSAGVAIKRLDAMAKQVPLDAPWDAPKASEWDAQTIQGWMSATRVPTRMARDLLDATFRALFACEGSETSLLHLLLLIHSAGGLTPLMTVENGYQHEQFVGGAQSIALAMAADLGSSLVLDAPVRLIEHRGPGVVVHADGVTVTARDVVVAIPPALVGHIRFDPPLPGDRALLYHAIPAGTEVKAIAIYDEPFWRTDDASGASVAFDTLVEVTLDTSPPDGSFGVIAGYAAAGKARRFWQLSKAERQRSFVDVLANRFGPKARAIVEYEDMNWAEEEFTRGCSMAHWPAGVITQYGRLLREPMGHIHWAGTETAGQSHGALDGAVRSGERVAEELLHAG